MKHWFNATARFKDLATAFPTAGDLTSWIERYVFAHFPKAGVEYWSDNRFTQHGYIPSAVLPDPSKSGCDLHEVVCYVQHGHCEGELVRVGLLNKDGQLRSLTFAKIFGNIDECHQICAAVYQALDHIFFYQEKPLLVDLAEKIPRERNWKYATSLTEKILVTFDERSIVVKTESGATVLDERSFDDKGPNAKFAVESFRKDWATVLNNIEKVEWAEVDLCAPAEAPLLAPA